MKRAGLIGTLGSVAILACAVRGEEMSKDGNGSDGTPAPETAKAFLAFYGRLKLGFDKDFVYVGSDGMPDHKMMVGITAWQQQVPLPQNYTGSNAWRIPLKPIEAQSPLSAKDHFFRGAIALAVNGIPIFNPIKNDGKTDTLIAGELDEFGGHCGRGDDYHYHIAPLHLEKIVGEGKPIAYALDGYAIYGRNERDGSPVKGLDAINGHKDANGSYHYHATQNYPYLNGGFHGVVTEAGGQVDPQPHASPLRPAGEPLRGASITDFTSEAMTKFTLTYAINGKPRTITYSIEADGSYKFGFTEADGSVRNEVYRRNERGGGGGRAQEGGPRGQGDNGGRRPRDNNDNPPPRPGAETAKPRAETQSQNETPPVSIAKPVAGFALKSSVVADGGALPVEFTGDGEGASPPLEWTGAPTGTKSYAIIMHHIAPGNEVKWYWTLWDIPGTTTGIPKNSKAIGTLGSNGINKRAGYAPPHSKGPGLKTYTITVYALSSAPQFTTPAAQVDRDALLAAIKDRILGTAELKVTYTKPGSDPNDRGGPREGLGEPQRPKPRAQNSGGQDDKTPPPPPPPRDDEPPAPRAENGPPGENPGGPAGDQRGAPRKPWLQNHGAELDANSDGIITFEELTADMNKAFALYDRNNDGVITTEEVKAAGEIRDGAAFAGFLHRHFAELDTNGDGKVSREESQSAAKYIFDAADLDKDGKLSEKEWMNAPNTPLRDRPSKSTERGTSPVR